jgi:nitrilase
VEETRFGLSICYDVRFPELYRGLMTAGAEVLCVPSQFQVTTGKDHWHTLLQARAIENQCFVVAPGQWGPYGDPAEGRRSYGHSLVVDPWGRIVVEAPEEGTGVWVADLDLAALRSLRHKFPVLQHRRLGASC